LQTELADKVVLISGSTRGLGSAIADAVAGEGGIVAVNSRNVQDVERKADSLSNAIAVAADVTDPTACRGLVERVVSKAGRLDGLVCNVGSGRSVAPGSETASEWRRVFDANLFSATNLIEAALPELIKTKGSIVCISSICGSVALGAPATYSVAKAALNAMVRNLARPLGAKDVRLNAVAPGNLIFPGSVWEKRLAEDAPAVQRMLDSEVSLRRLGKPAEIASLVTFLLSPAASFITGAIMIADGGQLRG
jgi:3-oxoacyl-[acyl-carrier protein] reductase